MNKSIFVSILLLLVCALPAAAVKYAWWVTIEYEPETTQILGIPVSELDPNWELAEPLSEAAIPPENMPDFQRDTGQYGYSFSKEGDFNSNGKKEKAIVGIYQEKNGDVGRFLLIYEDIENKKWSLLKSPGRSGFSILALNENELSWYMCMECDIFSYVVWGDNAYRLEPGGY